VVWWCAVLDGYPAENGQAAHDVVDADSLTAQSEPAPPMYRRPTTGTSRALRRPRTS